MRNELRYLLAGGPGRRVLDALLSTVTYTPVDARTHWIHPDPARPVIYVLWHGRLLPLAHFMKGRALATLISQSRDGEYIARVVAGWGFHVVRGSSSRGGGSALHALLRHAEAGRSIALTPDGPRGPQRRMKLGPLYVARRSGLPLIPVTAGVDRAWWFESWDRFAVPKPFAQVNVVFGTPVEVPGDADRAHIEASARQIETTLNRITEAADARHS